MIKIWETFPVLLVLIFGLLLHDTGIGPKRAMELIRQYKSIEEIIKHIDTKVILLCVIHIE